MIYITPAVAGLFLHIFTTLFFSTRQQIINLHKNSYLLGNTDQNLGRLYDNMQSLI